MTDTIIKVGYLVSYDWKLLQHSIPQVYADADIIMLALDRSRRTWEGNSFEFDEEAFATFIKRIDHQHKIKLYNDNFYVPELSTMQNEVRERNMLATALGKGGWHIQLDADEYPLDFSSFVKVLRRIDPNPDPDMIKKPVNVLASLITIIKKVPGGFIYVKPSREKPEWYPLATQVPNYEHGRRNGYFNIQSPAIVIHESRSRSYEEFYFKLKNWGHNRDFDVDSYYAMWKAIDKNNYRFIKDFNPIGKNTWPELSFVPADNVAALIDHFQANATLIQPSAVSMAFKNSRNIARIKRVWDMVFDR